MLVGKSLRIDTADLKAQMLKQIGSERFKQYFYYLGRFVSQRLSKADFDRLCHWTLGRENLTLHNQIIKSILKNACNAKPPPVHEVGPAKPAASSVKNLTSVDGHGQGGFAVQNRTLHGPLWCNGVVLPSSPRKSRSGFRDCKIRDRNRPIRLKGKKDSASTRSTVTEYSCGKTVKDRNSLPCDFQRPVQHHRLEEQHEDMQEIVAVDISLDSKENIVHALEVGDEVEQGDLLGFPRNPLLPPLGIPFCLASVGGTSKSLPIMNTGNFDGCYNRGMLSDTKALMKHMDQVAIAHGLGAVTSECANLLNNALDLYIKRLIMSCVGLVGARSGNNTTKCTLQKQQAHGRLMNGLWPSSHFHLRSGIGPSEEQKTYCSVSLVDFKVAVELNPRQLGESWPSILEKISQSFEE